MGDTVWIDDSPVRISTSSLSAILLGLLRFRLLLCKECQRSQCDRFSLAYYWYNRRALIFFMMEWAQKIYLQILLVLVVLKTNERLC